MRTRFSVPTMVVGLVVVLASTAGAQRTPLKIKEEKAGLLKQAKISPAEAQKTAQAKFPSGTIKSGEIEKEGGKLIYSFDIQQAGVRGIEEVNVDALTGVVVAMEHENPADEAKEKAKEHAKPKAKKPPA